MFNYMTGNSMCSYITVKCVYTYVTGNNMCSYISGN
jgi:hypothetical protein